MPTAPPVIFTPPAAPTPAAGPAVFTPPGVPTPSAPGAVFTPPTGGEYQAVIGGTLSPNASGTLIYAGLLNGRACWTGDGTLDFLLSGNTILYYLADDGPQWILQKYLPGPKYVAKVASDAATPHGLTGWTNEQGTGQPTVTITGAPPLAAPPVIFVP